MPSEKIYRQASELKALGSVRRLEILSFLKKKKSAVVGDIAEAIRISQESASQHLRILRLVGIVTSVRRGKNVSYRIRMGIAEPARGVVRDL